MAAASFDRSVAAHGVQKASEEKDPAGFVRSMPAEYHTYGGVIRISLPLFQDCGYGLIDSSVHLINQHEHNGSDSSHQKEGFDL